MAPVGEHETAVRFVRSALRLMIERVPDGTPLAQILRDGLAQVGQAYPEAQEPPWDTEPDENPVERTWGDLVTGDWARGGDGAYYQVTGVRPDNGRLLVTILVRGRERTYPRTPTDRVVSKRGPFGAAVDVLAAAGLGPEVIGA